MRKFLLLFLCSLAAFFSIAQPGKLDPSFNTIDVGFGKGDGANASITGISAVQSDGKILIVGDYYNYNGKRANYINRLNADGTIDASFNPSGVGPDFSIYALAVQSDGKILIGGIFSYYNNVSRKCIARLNADGSLDASFNPGTGANNTVFSIAVQSDGKILLGGYFTAYNSTPCNRIVRLNLDGTLDAAFNPGSGPGSDVSMIALQSNGKILIGGAFTTFNGVTANRIARLNADGTLDGSFNSGSGASSNVKFITVQSDDKIYIGGSFTSYNGISRSRIARLNADGTLDGAFNPGNSANNEVLIAAIQGDGKIVIGGTFTNYNGVTANRIARLNVDGTLDGSFNSGSGANDFIRTIVFQKTDNKILIGGLFSSYSNSLCSKGIARLNTDGSLDASFNSGSTGANSSIVAIAIQKTDKKILIGGDFTGFNGTLRSKIARINPDGTLDPSFNPGTGVAESIFSGPTVNSIAVQLDGKIVIGGLFDSYNGTSRRRVARINSDGSIDNTFNPGIGVNGSVYAVAVQSDGKILIGGGFPTYNGVTCNGLIRVNADGSVDASYKIGSGTGSSGEIDCIAIQGDGKILIGGTFTSFNGSSCSRIARLNTDGTLDPTFSIGSGANYTIKAITVQSDGKILVGGSFYSYRGADLYYLARLNADGTVDATFKPGTGANAQVSSIAIDGDGKILITGAFTNFNGVNSSYIARLYTNGTADASFNSGGGIDNSINTAIIQDDGNIVVGGSFTSYNNIGRNRLARVFGGSLDMGVIASSSFCPGSTINLPFTVKGAYNAGNVFTVQLSNAAGSFAAPVNIGTLASTVSGTISATIPTATTAGTGYRIRVVSSNPVVTSSNNGSNLTINAVTAITTQPSSQTKNEGDRVDFSVTASGSNLHYQWKKGTTTVGVDANAYSISSASTADAGDYTVIITGDCGSVTSSTATLKVKTTPTFNFALSVTKTYGDIDFSDAANSTNPASINYSSSDPSIATISNAGVVHIIKAGTVTFTASQPADATYNAASATQTLTINQKALTITADNKTKLQGTANPALTVSYAGFITGESASNLTTLPVVSTSATTSSPAGTYTITANGAVSNNYAISYVNGTLTITSKPVANLSFAATATKTYGAGDFNAAATSNSVGVISYSGDNNEVATVSTDGTVHIKKAGTVQITATQAETADYGPAIATQTLTINKAPLRITADNKTKLEGMANPELTASYSGFVSGESQSVLTSLPGLSTAASTLSPAGTYDIDVKNAAADNYDITYVKGTLTVNPLANNLKVSSTSESCKTSNNGEINITATQPLTYTATITGNSTPNSYSFTSSKKIDNLSAGTYNVCVTAEELVGYQQCYNVEVTEPKDLSAYARVNRNQKTITVDLSGAARYWIELNGKIYSTTESQITLPALSTNNVLKVATDKPCQGVIERNINLSGEVLVYPNPFSDKVRIDLGSSDASKVQVEVSDLLGKKVYSATLVNNNNIEVDLSSLVTGVYMVKVTAGNSISTHKIIKK